MPIAFEIADRIFREEKQLLRPFRWRSVESKNMNEQRRCLECRVDVAGGVPRGVQFRITVYPGSLARATFQLECDLPAGRTHVPLYRLELGPRRGHMNKLYGTGDLPGLILAAGETHEHLFYDSLRSDKSLRASAVEQARRIETPPADFPTALALVCSRNNIINGSDIPNPGDQGRLL
ncbi:hypothetical protein BAL199_01354 [alpha proteobacterium BAL199]|nr:hypothetical protein BAL199_01354 [alpha proteobacterium BAL199]